MGVSRIFSPKPIHELRKKVNHYVLQNLFGSFWWLRKNWPPVFLHLIGNPISGMPTHQSLFKSVPLCTKKPLPPRLKASKLLLNTCSWTFGELPGPTGLMCVRRHLSLSRWYPINSSLAKNDTGPVDSTPHRWFYIYISYNLYQWFEYSYFGLLTSPFFSRPNLQISPVWF